MRLTDDERQALHLTLVPRELPSCKACGLATYPWTWCECDPRDQVFAFEGENCVYLQAEDPALDDAHS